jgi:microcystin-dependent protein
MPVSRGYSFGATEQVTNAKLHSLVDDATVTGLTDSAIASDAAIDSSKISFNLADYVTLSGTQTITGSKTFSGTVTFSGSTNIGVPVGGTVQWWTATPPTGWLLCDGSAVSRTTYSDLFGVISTDFGVGDNSTTFNLPNLKGKIPVGQNSSESEFNLIGETGGAKTHALTEAELAAHTHTIAKVNALGGVGAGAIVQTALATDGNNTSGSTGSGTAHNNLQPYIVCNYIIRY